MGLYDFDKNQMMCKRCRGCVKRNLPRDNSQYCGGLELWDYKNQGLKGFPCYAGTMSKLVQPDGRGGNRKSKMEGRI